MHDRSREHEPVLRCHPTTLERWPRSRDTSADRGAKNRRNPHHTTALAGTRKTPHLWLEERFDTSNRLRRVHNEEVHALGEARRDGEAHWVAHFGAFGLSLFGGLLDTRLC